MCLRASVVPLDILLTPQVCRVRPCLGISKTYSGEMPRFENFESFLRILDSRRVQHLLGPNPVTNFLKRAQTPSETLLDLHYSTRNDRTPKENMTWQTWHDRHIFGILKVIEALFPGAGLSRSSPPASQDSANRRQGQQRTPICSWW